MLNKEICLKCCRKVREREETLFEHELGMKGYLKKFDEDWEDGFLWCGKQQKWLDLTWKKRVARLHGNQLEEVISNCPYIVEHAVVSGAKLFPAVKTAVGPILV